MEIIIINNATYNVKNISTSANNISFTITDNDIVTVKNIFKEVTSLSVADFNTPEEIYGTYKNLSFVSATVYGDGSTMVTMHIKSDTEIRFESLEQTQAEQDEVLAELLGGEA